MTSDRSLICPPSKRGHTWTGLGMIRTCARCHRRGMVNAQGLIDVLPDETHAEDKSP